MQTRLLGSTGMMVSTLGYGAAGIADMDEPTTTLLLNAALDAGLTIIDTAECYTRSEEMIGSSVAHRRDQYALFTKVGHASGLPFTDWDPRMVRPSLERSLKRLRTDRIDLAQLHTCSLAQLQDGGLISALQGARAAGLCRFIGYSGDGEAARWAVRSGAFDTLQTSVNIADQEAVATSAEAKKRGLGVIAKRPVANAVWRSGAQAPAQDNLRLYWERLQQLDYPFLQGPRAAEMALRFTLSVDGVSTALVHTTSPKRWSENAVSAHGGPLPSLEYEAIRSRWQTVAKADWVGQT